MPKISSFALHIWRVDFHILALVFLLYFELSHASSLVPKAPFCDPEAIAVDPASW